MSNAFELYKGCITSAEGDLLAIAFYLGQACESEEVSPDEYRELSFIAKAESAKVLKENHETASAARREAITAAMEGG